MLNPTDGAHGVPGFLIIRSEAEPLATLGCHVLSPKRLEQYYVIIVTRSIIAPCHSGKSGIAGAG